MVCEGGIELGGGRGLGLGWAEQNRGGGGLRMG